MTASILAGSVIAPTIARAFAATAPLRWNVLIITNDQHRATVSGVWEIRLFAFDPPAPFDRMYGGANFPQSHKMEGEMKNKPPQQQKALEDSAGFDLRTMTERDLNRIKSYYYGMIYENDKYLGVILDQLASL